MENYEFVKSLGNGLLGDVDLVKSKQKLYALKKIECRDDSEADRVLEEIKVLNSLYHKNICTAVDFFKWWDEQNFAIYANFILPYYENNLAIYLSKSRVKVESIPSDVLKKLVGQIFNGLKFLHHNKIFHRNLKPSNIFLTEDMSAVIGDISSPLLMKDIIRKSQSSDDSSACLALEVLKENIMEERCDVWSLGCVTLQMATCSLLNETETHDFLCRIKTSSQVLEPILEEITTIYHGDLCKFLRMMLQRNINQRPTLPNFESCCPYLESCLEVCAVDEFASNEEINEMQEQCHIPTDKGVKGVLRFMHCPSTLLPSLDECASLLSNGETVTAEDKSHLLSVMKSNCSNLNVQIKFCNLFTIIETNNVEVLDINKELISAISAAMQFHSTSADLQLSAVQLLIIFTVHESTNVGRSGCIHDILTAIRLFPSSAHLATAACQALWALTIKEENVRIVCEEKGLLDIFRVMKLHKDNDLLIENAAAVIWSLSLIDKNVQLIADNGAMEILLTALSVHKTNAKVTKNVFMAISSIISVSEGCAYELLSGINGRNGIAFVLDAFRSNLQNEELIKYSTETFINLAKYADLFAEVSAKSVQEVLEDARAKCPDDRISYNYLQKALNAIKGV